MRLLGYVKNDGGRAADGFKGRAGDCVARSVAIALDLYYDEVWHALARELKRLSPRHYGPDHGCAFEAYEPWLAARGWHKVTVPAGTHLCADDLPWGRLIVYTYKHVTAVINREEHSSWRAGHSGRRKVLWYYTKQ